MEQRVKEVSANEYVEIVESDANVVTTELGVITLSKGSSSSFGNFVAISTCDGRYAVVT